MPNPTKIILGAIALLGGAYYITYRRAYETLIRCKFAIDRVFLDAIDKSGFVIGIRLKITNPSSNSLRLSNGNKLFFYINNQKVAHVYVPYPQIIAPQDSSDINLAVSADFSDMGGWWNYLLDISNTADIKVAGSIRINGLSVPIPPITVYRYNIEDIVKKVKNYSVL